MALTRDLMEMNLESMEQVEMMIERYLSEIAGQHLNIRDKHHLNAANGPVMVGNRMVDTIESSLMHDDDDEVGDQLIIDEERKT